MNFMLNQDFIDKYKISKGNLSVRKSKTKHKKRMFTKHRVNETYFIERRQRENKITEYNQRNYYDYIERFNNQEIAELLASVTDGKTLSIDGFLRYTLFLNKEKSIINPVYKSGRNYVIIKKIKDNFYKNSQKFTIKR